MNTLVSQTPRTHFNDGRIFMSFPNGVAFSFPISGNWRLERATQEQLENVEADDEGLHWPDIDEDLSFEGLLRGDYGQFARRPALSYHSQNVHDRKISGTRIADSR